MAKLIIGLGNPGKEYESTRHNVGFLVLDEFAKKHNFEITKEKFGGLFNKVKINNKDVFVGKPLTFMNLSGLFIKEITSYYKINIEDILIIYDDKDIMIGNHKLKKQGSSAGHNGIKDIINQLGTKEFNRLKIGIGNSNGIKDIKSYVLKNFSKEDMILLKNNYQTYINIIQDFIDIDFTKLQERYNG